MMHLNTHTHTVAALSVCTAHLDTPLSANKPLEECTILRLCFLFLLHRNKNDRASLSEIAHCIFNFTLFLFLFLRCSFICSSPSQRCSVHRCSSLYKADFGAQFQWLQEAALNYFSFSLSLYLSTAHRIETEML